MPHNIRILIAHFNGKPATALMIHHAVIEKIGEVAENYNEIILATNLFSRHNILLQIEDCNVRFATDYMKHMNH